MDMGSRNKVESSQQSLVETGGISSRASLVVTAVAAHRAAYAADDALYGENCRPVTKDRKVIRAADALERQTLRSFALVRCATHEDVQEKLNYLLTGTAANQVTVWDALSLDRYAEKEWKGTGQSPLQEECLATMVLDAVDNLSASGVACFATPGRCARENA